MLPPSGLQYSTVARFEDDANNWPNEAWSIVVELSGQLPASLETTANIRFLVPNAPNRLLQPGSRFELYEGRRMVANGQVIDSE